jgi:hypothetical protein
MPACVLSHVRDNTKLTDFFFLFCRTCDWLSYTAALTLFHYYPGCDIPQNHITLYILHLVWNETTQLHTHTYLETFISSLTFIAMDGFFFFFFFGSFGSSVLGFGGRFQWNGRRFRLSHFRYMPNALLITISLSPKFFMTPGLPEHFSPTFGRCRWLS